MLNDYLPPVIPASFEPLYIFLFNFNALKGLYSYFNASYFYNSSILYTNFLLQFKLDVHNLNSLNGVLGFSLIIDLVGPVLELLDCFDFLLYCLNPNLIGDLI